MNKRILALLLFVSALSAWQPAYAQPATSPVTTTHAQQDVAALLHTWLATVKSGKAESVAALYAADATLLPTLSAQVLRTPKDRLDYFTMFVSKPGIAGKVDQEYTRVLGDTAVNSGLYTFTYQDNGKTVAVPARYTFVYQKTAQGWIIVEHHSSKLP